MICVDTTHLKDLVVAASVANEAIEHAVDALNRVSVHNDWGCKEKTAINDYAITNKNRVKQLQENSRSFLNVITQVSNEFEASEIEILDLFSSVEGLIGDIIAITPSPVSYPTPPVNDWGDIDLNSIIKNIPQTTLTDQFKEVFDQFNHVSHSVISAFENFQWTNIIEPIRVCAFDSITLE